MLALEGHGAGYLPEIDRRQLTPRNVTGRPEVRMALTQDHGGSPVLPVVRRCCRAARRCCRGLDACCRRPMPLSTWGLGAALKAALDAGVPKLAVIHFNNCFNMSAEVLHTVAPYAEYATGYPNYNFFTAGEAIRRCSRSWRSRARRRRNWRAPSPKGNQKILEAKGNHPTLGCTVRLARMKDITERLDDLADALLDALRSPPPHSQARAAVVQEIGKAIVQAQQFDTERASAWKRPTSSPTSPACRRAAGARPALIPACTAAPRR